MGVDWYPFQLKPNVTRTEFEETAARQREYFLEWYTGTPAISDPSRRMEDMADFGHADEMPEYIDAIRIPPVDDNPVFPASWKFDLFRTCFPEEADRLVARRVRWIELLRQERLPNYLKLRYIEYSAQELVKTWTWLQESVQAVRSRPNNWATRPLTLEACDRIESVPTPQPTTEAYFESYEKSLAASPWTDPPASNDIDDLVAEAEETVKNYITICCDWNRAVKAEKCHCLAESFVSFKEKMHDPFLDEFFEWAAKWLRRGYGMFLSF